ncbi:MSC_0624 family F1-like ATPase-associated membrane protein [Candidatus Mycoplasma pogonae]
MFEPNNAKTKKYSFYSKAISFIYNKLTRDNIFSFIFFSFIFIISLIVVFLLEKTFFSNGNYINGLENLFKNTATELVFYNVVIILRSALFYTIFLFAALKFYNNFISNYLRNKFLYLYQLIYFVIMILGIVCFFALEINDMKTIFYFSLLFLIFWIMDFFKTVYFATKKKNFYPLAKKIQYSLYLSYFFRLILMIIFYITFAFLVFNKNIAPKTFVDNSVVLFFDHIFSNIKETKWQVSLFFMIFGTFILLILSNIHFVLFYNFFEKNITKPNFILGMFAIIFTGGILFWFKVSFSKFNAYDPFFDTNLNWLALYIIIVIQVFILIVVILLEFIFVKKIKYFTFNPEWRLVLILFFNILIILILSFIQISQQELFLVILVNTIFTAILTGLILLKNWKTISIFKIFFFFSNYLIFGIILFINGFNHELTIHNNNFLLLDSGKINLLNTTLIIFLSYITLNFLVYGSWILGAFIYYTYYKKTKLKRSANEILKKTKAKIK